MPLAGAPVGETMDARYCAIRRERTADGRCLHFTGSDAHGGPIDRIFDEIEAIFQPG